MVPLSGTVTLFLIAIFVKVSVAYMEALAANADVNSATKYEPMVAFICNKPAMHRVVDGWVADPSTDCIKNPVDILKYCRKTYPDHDITNVVETSYKVMIPSWPNTSGRTQKHSVVPYRCIVGPFESDALLVPQHCYFDHDHDKSCERYQHWNETATRKCESKKMVTESFAMLLACGVDKFNGVEYVCCPPEASKKHKMDVSSETSEDKDSQEDTDAVLPKNTDETPEYNAYMAYLRGDDKYFDKDENEHAKFLGAEKAMQVRHHAKITAMMKDWQAAREHVSELRKTDYNSAEQLNKEITQRFQKMYHAYEQEGEAEKKQIVALHQQHVQAYLNKRKRDSMEHYMAELQKDPVKPHRALKALQGYIRAEEKDRMHTINHYDHVRDTDPTEAERILPQIKEHLKTIDQRINQSMEMLHHFPSLEEKVLPEIVKFRAKFRGIEISAANVVLQSEPEEYSNEYEPELEPTDVEVPSISIATGPEDARYDPETFENEHSFEDKHFVAHLLKDDVHVQKSGIAHHPTIISSSTGSVFGIAIGSVAVFVIIVIAVVMLRKRSHRQPITHGFVEVDPAASPEERHVANMQMNGYENPTYKYFEKGQGPAK